MSGGWLDGWLVGVMAGVPVDGGGGLRGEGGMLGAVCGWCAAVVLLAAVEFGIAVDWAAVVRAVRRGCSNAICCSR